MSGPNIPTLVLVAYALIGAAPVMAASLAPVLNEGSKTEKPAREMPASFSKAMVPLTEIRAETYLFVGQDDLTFNEGAGPVLDLMPASGDAEEAPLNTGKKSDRPQTD